MIRTHVHANATAAKGYYTEGLSRQDYYSEGQEIAGSWGGKAAELLNLRGQVEQAGFSSLCENLHPETGEQLTPRTRINRRVGYDFNFHCPKSVSVLHGLTGDARIVESFRASVQETMCSIESGMNTRVRRFGAQEDRATGNMAWAEFVHFTSRPVGGVPDCHLHAHCFVFNATFDGVEKRWKAGEFAGIKNDLEYHEAAFHLNLANRLQKLGYAIERRGKGWEIADVSPEVIAKFSRRTAAIEAVAKAAGITNAKQKDQIGARSRNKKEKSLTTSELRRAWEERLTENELAALRKAAHGGGRAAPVKQSAAEAVDYAIEQSFARKSVVSRNKLQALAIRRAIGSGADLASLESALSKAQLLVKKTGGKTLVTTQKILAEERTMIAFAQNGRGRESALNANYYPAAGFLAREQKAAIRHVLQSKDRVISVRGGAGTGKTTLMSEAVVGIKAGGKAVFAFAPSAIASRKVLREEGFANAETVARLLMDAKLQKQVKNQVIWIDEAGLLSVRDTMALFEVAAQQNARVVLAGDTRQHSAVERGDALRILETTGAVVSAEVNEIRRQRGEYKQAIEAISQGRTAKAFEIFDALGCVREVSRDQLAEQMAADYVAALEKGSTALAISPTHYLGEKLSQEIRKKLRGNGMIQKTEWEVYQQINLNWTDAEKRDVSAYQVGDVVQFNQNVKGFRWGERVMITGRDAAGGLSCSSLHGVPQKTPFLPDHPNRFGVYRRATLDLAAGDQIRITQGGYTKNRCRLENGSVYRIKRFGKEGIECENGFQIPWDYGNLAYGYATTSHAAQGRTVDEVFIAQSDETLAASSREQFYVSASRGRKRAVIYTDDKDALLETVGASKARPAAVEVFTPKTRKMSMFDKFRDKVGDLFGKTQPERSEPKTDAPKKEQPVQHEDKVFSGEAAKKESVTQKGIMASPQPGSQIGGQQPTQAKVAEPAKNEFAPVQPQQTAAKNTPGGLPPSLPPTNLPKVPGMTGPYAPNPQGPGVYPPTLPKPPKDNGSGPSHSPNMPGQNAPGISPLNLPKPTKDKPGPSLESTLKTKEGPGVSPPNLPKPTQKPNDPARARERVLPAEQARENALLAVKQKGDELQKQHTAKQIQAQNQPAAQKQFTQQPWVAKVQQRAQPQVQRAPTPRRGK